MKKYLIKTSKFLSFVLRHKPEEIGIRLNSEGWAQVDELIAAAQQSGVPLNRELLKQIVEENDKQRFSLSEDGLRIRANQGHSISVKLGLEPLVLPAWLFHGTATRFLDSIRQQGLLPKGRQHVHLSPDEPTAVKVGQRHGKPVVLTIQSGEMHERGFTFYRSVNGVWLTDSVPAEYLVFPATC